jgi:hypothetical protein
MKEAYQTRMDYIINNFMNSLRKVVEAQDVADFIYVNLIPELTILLIKDDMQVDEEKARSILKESAAAGEIIGKS